MKQIEQTNERVGETQTKKAIMIVMSERQMTLLKDIVDQARTLATKSASPDFDMMSKLLREYDEEIKELLDGQKTN